MVTINFYRIKSHLSHVIQLLEPDNTKTPNIVGYGWAYNYNSKSSKMTGNIFGVDRI